MQLDSQMLAGIKAHTDKITQKVTLVLATGEHPDRASLHTMLQQLADLSAHIDLVERDFGARSALAFTIEREDAPTGIIFSGIPGGHEFTSLILAILQAGGVALKLDANVQQIIKNISQPLKFETFVSLSCHVCPDVVQALNQFALLNPNISNETIDGGAFPELVEERNIQGVPCVYLNGAVFANGKIDTAKLLEKLLASNPELLQAAPSEKLPLQDVTVIGGGPAGSAAAIYAARKGLAVTIIAERIGGQVKDTQDIENLISVPLTTGSDLAVALGKHIGEYPITVKEHIGVKSVTANVGDHVHRVELVSGEQIDTKALIIATGAKWRELGIEGERENIGNGVAYCPHCDGPFFKGKDIAVIGGGNSGIEAALDLAGIVKSVTVVEFMPTLKADEVLVAKLRERDNVQIITNAACKAIHTTDGKVSSLSYVDRNTDSEQQLPLAGVFVQIGLVPNSAFVADVVQRSQFGEILINAKGETNVKGIFACGDVTNVPYKQIIIAMGEGAKAALSAYDYLLMS